MAGMIIGAACHIQQIPPRFRQRVTASVALKEGRPEGRIDRIDVAVQRRALDAQIVCRRADRAQPGQNVGGAQFEPVIRDQDLTSFVMSHQRAFGARLGVWCANAGRRISREQTDFERSSPAQRYHTVLVALHWLMVLMILVALAVGGLVLANMPPDSSDKVAGLGGHMIFGMAIGVLLVLRLVTRTRCAHPPAAATGGALLDRIGRCTHWGFYALIAGMVLTRLATALGAGLFPIVYGGAAETRPPELATLPQCAVHGFIATLLVALIALHAAAALYHQFVLNYGLLRRMWFGKRRTWPGQGKDR